MTALSIRNMNRTVGERELEETTTIPPQEIDRISKTYLEKLGTSAFDALMKNSKNIYECLLEMDRQIKHQSPSICDIHGRVKQTPETGRMSTSAANDVAGYMRNGF